MQYDRWSIKNAFLESACSAKLCVLCLLTWNCQKLSVSLYAFRAPLESSQSLTHDTLVTKHIGSQTLFGLWKHSPLKHVCGTKQDDLCKKTAGVGRGIKEKKDVRGAPAQQWWIIYHVLNTQTGKGEKSPNYDRVGDEPVPFYYFVKKHPQVIFTDDNELSSITNSLNQLWIHSLTKLHQLASI